MAETKKLEYIAEVIKKDEIFVAHYLNIDEVSCSLFIRSYHSDKSKYFARLNIEHHYGLNDESFFSEDLIDETRSIKEIIDKLKTFKWNETNSKIFYHTKIIKELLSSCDESLCYVCQEDTEFYLKQCKHSICKKCFYKMVNRDKYKCGICRRKYTDKDFEGQDEDEEDEENDE